MDISWRAAERRSNRHACLRGALFCLWAATAAMLSWLAPWQAAQAATVTFDALTPGSSSFAADGDGDLINDVVFTTLDPAGFNVMGPGPNQSFVSEPALEGGRVLGQPDLRVDFLFGAFGPLSFGFVVGDSVASLVAISFSVFDTAGNLLVLVTEASQFTTPDGINPSSFPEGQLVADFGSSGAAYALFEFDDSLSGGRYIIDNFAGTFGSTEDTPGIPEPSSVAMLAAGVLALLCAPGYRNRRRPA